MSETLIQTAVVAFAVGFVGGRVMWTRALARRIAEVEARVVACGRVLEGLPPFGGVSVSREGLADYVTQKARTVSAAAGQPLPQAVSRPVPVPDPTLDTGGPDEE